MTPEQLRDLQASLVVLTHLEAGFKGALAYQEFLRKVGSARSNQRSEILAQKGLAKVFRWMESLENGAPLVSLSWSKPETFEARDAFAVMEQLRKETQSLFTDTCKIFSVSSTRLSVEDVQIALATLLRCEVCEFSFVARQRLIAEAEQVPEEIETSRILLQEAVREGAPALALINDYTEGNQVAGPGFISNLLVFLGRLPMRVALQLHNLNMLLGSYSGVGYDMVEIPPREVPKWQALGFPAEEASFWRAHGFLPDEVLQWRQRGFSALQEAFEWHDRGFSAAEAWSLREAGHDPESAEMMRTGVIKPETRGLTGASMVGSKREAAVAHGTREVERARNETTAQASPVKRTRRVQTSDMTAESDLGVAPPSEIVQTAPRGGRPIGSVERGVDRTGGEYGAVQRSGLRTDGTSRKGKLIANSK